MLEMDSEEEYEMMYDEKQQCKGLTKEYEEVVEDSEESVEDSGESERNNEKSVEGSEESEEYEKYEDKEVSVEDSEGSVEGSEESEEYEMYEDREVSVEDSVESEEYGMYEDRDVSVEDSEGSVEGSEWSKENEMYEDREVSVEDSEESVEGSEESEEHEIYEDREVTVEDSEESEGDNEESEEYEMYEDREVSVEDSEESEEYEMYEDEEVRVEGSEESEEYEMYEDNEVRAEDSEESVEGSKEYEGDSDDSEEDSDDSEEDSDDSEEDSKNVRIWKIVWDFKNEMERSKNEFIFCKWEERIDGDEKEEYETESDEQEAEDVESDDAKEVRQEDEKCLEDIFDEASYSLSQIYRIPRFRLLLAIKSIRSELSSRPWKSPFYSGIDFDITKCCAYLTRYASAHYYIAARSISTVLTSIPDDIFQNLVDLKEMNVVSVGGGPGNDLMSFCSNWCKVGNAQYLHLSVIDLKEGWKPSFQNILTTVCTKNFGEVSVFLRRTLVTSHFVCANLVHSQPEIIEEADVVLMTKFLSVVNNSEKDIILKNIFSKMKRNALFIYTDIEPERVRRVASEEDMNVIFYSDETELPYDRKGCIEKSTYGVCAVLIS